MNIGHEFSRDGVRPDRNKVAEIVEWPQPITYKSLHSFNCLAGWFREFVPNFASIMEPLTSVQLKKGKIVWDEHMERAFKLIKDVFSQDLMLAYPDYTRKMDLFVDASLVGMGACLVQKDDKGVFKIITAISRAFRGAERNYSATKRELRAVVWSLKRLERWLKGGRFTLHTDHRALTFMLTPDVEPVG